MYIGQLFKRSLNLNQRLTIVSNTFEQKMNIGQDFNFVLINDPILSYDPSYPKTELAKY